ncbi:MAG TPA: hypothetical protein DEA45_03025 [Acholeplasmataceae bacterium]|nr:hypothetical protein [Acholeplasmataceae bacterium]
MGERITLDKNKKLILLYNGNRSTWEDRTNSVTAIFKAYYYRKFTGYDVYFKNGSNKFFYKKENVQFLDLIEIVDISKRDVFLDNQLFNATKVERFQQSYYRITADDKTFLSQNISFKTGKCKDIYSYYSELASYAGNISNDTEPLYYLAMNYQRIKPALNSVLYHFLEGKSEKTNGDTQRILVPFDFNQSQHSAIQKALDNSISVIEGPPGTGKTQTILNLLSNIVARNMNCAVVSNNNTAVNNVYEKLTEEGIGFFSATLGRYDKVSNFFENNSDQELEQFMGTVHTTSNQNTKERFDDLSKLMKSLHETEALIARLNNELSSVILEQKNQNLNIESAVSINKKLKSTDYLRLINRLEDKTRFGIFESLWLNIKYKTKIHRVELSELILTAEKIYYETRITELKHRIDKLSAELVRNDKDKISDELKVRSKEYLFEGIKKHYKNIKIKSFDMESYKRDYVNFLKRYPIVLSTTQSLLNNAPKGFLFDYLIIDEASQGDLLSSVIAMSCAKNLVVVGDSKQLQQIDEERLFVESKRLARKHRVEKQYQYDSNSILKSVSEAVRNVPSTLLREHYRCAPDIINFCNQMFYNEELIPMTTNSGRHIEIIKTVPGNHARKNPKGTGLYNQREIDELVHVLKDKESDQIGVITPFRYQAVLIQDNLPNSKIEADTIHKFQGRQKDEIYLSFVVNSLEKDDTQAENRLYDFITNDKLLNVAISRGKHKVTLIVSDKIYYSKNNLIHDLIHYTENLYGNTVTKTSSLTSVFDYLYTKIKS